MSSETNNPALSSPTALLAVHRTEIKRLSIAVEAQRADLATAAIERVKLSGTVAALTDKVTAQTEEIRKFRHAVRDLTQQFKSLEIVRQLEAEQEAREAELSKPIQVGPVTGPQAAVVEETKARTRLWTALAAVATAVAGAVGWAMAKLSG